MSAKRASAANTVSVSSAVEVDDSQTDCEPKATMLNHTGAGSFKTRARNLKEVVTLFIGFTI